MKIFLKSAGIIILILSSIPNLNAQLEANWWYFGSNAGLNFSGGSPIPASDGAMYASEGSATISDPTTGDLLFYSEGINVYDASHNLMPNGTGLLGTPSSCQAALIVPKPGSTNLYYLFTTADDGINGCKYNVIDMNLNGGLGDIIAGFKNISLHDPASEQLSATKHANCDDYWIMAKDLTNDIYRAYLLTENGIVDTVISEIGLPLIGYSPGQAKFAPNGSKYAIATTYGPGAQLFDFDNETGLLSNAITISNSFNDLPFGLSFSGDNTKLYLMQGTGSNEINQYDVTLSTPAEILDSKTLIGSCASWGQLQLGNDHKIYAGGDGGSATVSVINNPNLAGLASNFSYLSVAIGGAQGYGFSNFPDNFFNESEPTLLNSLVDTAVCDGASLILNTQVPNATYLWQDNSTDSVFMVTESGIYWVQISGTCSISTDTTIVTYIDLPQFDIGEDTVVCEGSNLLLNAFVEGADSYIWQDNTTNPNYNAISQGVYFVLVSYNDCVLIDSLEISYFDSDNVNLGNDTTLCEGESLLIDLSTTSGNYVWGDGSTSNTNTITEEGIYWVDIILNDCTFRDSIEINYTNLPVLSIGNALELCELETYLIDVTTQDASYLWQDLSTQSILEVDNPGIYWVKITVDGCSTTDSINVIYHSLPKFSFGEDQSLCDGDIIELATGLKDATYLWHDNSSNPVFSVSQEGVFWSQITINNCSYTDTIIVDYDNEFCNCEIFVPNSFTPNGDGINDIFKAVSNCPLSIFDFKIYNRWGEIIYGSDDATKGWNGAIDNFYIQNGEYVWVLKSRVRGESKIEQSTGTITLLR